MDILDFLASNDVPILNGKILLPEFCKRVKIDVGLSSDASQSAVWLASDPELIVFGFEPVSSNVKALIEIESQAIFRFIGKQFFILPTALGSRTGSTQIYVTDIDAGRSSLMEPKNFPVTHVEEIPIFTLDQFLELFPFEIIGRIDFLKTDCQGGDLEILKGGSKFLNKIAVITSECDDSAYSESRNSLGEMISFLENLGFQCVNFNDFNKNYVPVKLQKIARIYVLVKSLTPIKVKHFFKMKMRARTGAEDPTFVNNRFAKLVESKEITFYQKG